MEFLKSIVNMDPLLDVGLSLKAYGKLLTIVIGGLSDSSLNAYGMDHERELFKDMLELDRSIQFLCCISLCVGFLIRPVSKIFADP